MLGGAWLEPPWNGLSDMDHRTERITEAIREELSEMIGYEMDDPRVGSAIVTEVQISPDKRHAMVRVRVGQGSDSRPPWKPLVMLAIFCAISLPPA